jgi:hypothetical protein
MTDYSVRRDWNGKPWVSLDGGPLRFEPGRKTPVNAEAYKRPSSLSNAIEGDKPALVQWKQNNVLVGVIRNSSLLARIGALISATGNPWYDVEGGGKKEIQELIKRAELEAGSDRAADEGSAFHSLDEQVCKGTPPMFIPDHLQPWLDAREEAMRDWEILDTELFVVQDQIRCAGSLDRVLRNRHTGQVVVGDVKTGNDDPKYPMKVAVQVGVYANSLRYDQKTGERSPIHPDLDPTEGILIHAPVKTGVTPKVTLYTIPLVQGWEAAKLADQALKAKKWFKDNQLEEVQQWTPPQLTLI